MAHQPHAPRADLVFRDGRILAAPGHRQAAHTSLAVAGDRIIATGSDADIDALADASTRVIDLDGGFLLPGFHDAHVHPLWGGMRAEQCDLDATHDATSAIEAVATYAAAHPAAPWITGGGWHMSSFAGGVPTKDLLDLVVPERPAFLMNSDGHGAWVNSRALELAGVDARTPDPIDGRFERDVDGAPSGTVHEGAVTAFLNLIPATTLDDRRRALLGAQRYLHSVGVTGWQDALVGDYGGYGDAYDAYRALDADELLTARVMGALWWDRSRGIEQLDELVARRDAANGRRFRATTVKIMQDGVAENFTASMLQPYLDGCGCTTSNSGIEFLEPEALHAAVDALHASTFHAHIHAIGDRAVRDALDAIERAIARHGRRPVRHHLAHIQIVDPNDVPRFAALGVAANCQAVWAVHKPQMDRLTIPFLGENRATHQYPFGALHRAGARLVMGSDWPVSTANPWAAIHVAVNRTTCGRNDQRPFLPEQRIDVATAIDAYTRGSAFVNGWDDRAAMLKPGRLADLVHVDRDPFRSDHGELGATRTLRTWVGGQLVFEA